MISGLVRGLTRSMVSNVIGVSSSGRATVAPFFYETEAQTFFAAALDAGVEPNTNRKRTYNRMIKRLKNYGVWSKLTHLYLLAADNQTISLINVKNPGTNNCAIVSAPVFTQNDGWQSGAGAGYLNTGVALNSLSQNDLSFGIYVSVNASSASSDFGAVDASLNGISINSFNIASSAAAGRCMTASIASIGSSNSVANSRNFIALSRNSSTSFDANKLGHNFTTNATASVTPGNNAPIAICGIGGASASTANRRISMAFLAPYLTETELRRLYACVHEYYETVKYGEYYIEEVGIGTSNITADIICYGATSSAITAAYQAARSGKTVAIIGGWRDRRIGGMSAGGLGFTDFDNHAGLGGLPRWIITKMNSIYSRADTTFYFEPRVFTEAIGTIMDSSLNGGYSIPVYFTNGVFTVNKTGAAITSITTVDGRTITGSRFIDCSYEGDLSRMAGVGMTKGREAAGTGKEGLNGFRGLLTTDSGNNHQFKVGSTLVNVDPYNTPGNSASGLLSGLSRDISACPANGTTDDEIQAYNFRLAFSNNTTHRIPLPNTPPTGYSASDWEPLGRLMAANPTIAISDLLKIDSLVATACYDINAKNGWSTDYWGGSKDYPAAGYAAREVIWKAHWNRILGLFYYLQYDPDSRVIAAVRTSALTYGFHGLHYPDHHENDDIFVSPQLYVREAWRMVSDVIWYGNDCAKTDGTTPRSTKTIATASYVMDSHSTEAISDPNAGNPRIWLTGNFESTAGGTDQITPVPYDIIIPKASECTNLFVTFAVSATHVAFGSVRMEYTSMMMGQAAGLAAVHSINDGVTVQNVDYTNLRTALLASATLSGEVAPVLPQLN